MATIRSTPDQANNERWHTLTILVNGNVVAKTNVYVQGDNTCTGYVGYTINP